LLSGVRYLVGMFRGALTALYARQVQFITVKRLDLPNGNGHAPGRPAPHDATCLVADTVEGLRSVAHEIPGTFRDSADDLSRRVAQGCVVCLARRKRDDGAGYDVVGYELAERGVFSALGRRKAVAPDVIFSHWAEVLPAYRGRRIHAQLFAARDAYFRARGGTIVVGVCARRNRASLKALRRDGARVVGSVRQVSVLRLLILWETPWARIEHALDVGRHLGASTGFLGIEELAPRHA
jgi:GNAT superfamily N-acetyltransferase